MRNTRDINLKGYTATVGVSEMIPPLGDTLKYDLRVIHLYDQKIEADVIDFPAERCWAETVEQGLAMLKDKLLKVL